MMRQYSSGNRAYGYFAVAARLAAPALARIDASVQTSMTVAPSATSREPRAAASALVRGPSRVRLPGFVASRSLGSASRVATYRASVHGGYGRSEPIFAAETLWCSKLCRDGSVVPCPSVPMDGGIGCDCLHVCPEDPPAFLPG